MCLIFLVGWVNRLLQLFKNVINTPDTCDYLMGEQTFNVYIYILLYVLYCIILTKHFNRLSKSYLKFDYGQKIKK